MTARRTRLVFWSHPHGDQARSLRADLPDGSRESGITPKRAAQLAEQWGNAELKARREEARA